jgi:hypothetical protein
MVYMTVVFETAVPLAERQRLLAKLQHPAIPDETEEGAYCVELPDDAVIMEWAERYADLLYKKRPALERVSWTRLRNDVPDGND